MQAQLGSSIEQKKIDDEIMPKKKKTWEQPFFFNIGDESEIKN